MKRIAVFAHYDQDNIVDDYVIYYIKELKKVADEVIFVSDSDISSVEIDKLSKYIVKAIAGYHGEYDFGSYKRGFLYALNSGLLDGCYELIFANDSCYGPMYPLQEMFDKMKCKDIDFWGATKNYFGFEYVDGLVVTKELPHIQSFFMVFREGVLKSEVLIDFMNNIKKENDKLDVIMKYEIGLTTTLNKAGFTCKSYAKEYPEYGHMQLVLWDELFNSRMPFIKTSILRLKNINIVNPLGWKQIIKSKCEYPIGLIEKDLLRNEVAIDMKIRLRMIRKWTISFNRNKQEWCILGRKYKI